jgi:predicted transposase/invertase (TIGR01784 family)
MIYEYRLKMARDERAKMQDAREEGLEEGRTKGMAEGLEKGMERGIERGILRTAKAMKAKGIDVNIIAEVTGMTVDDVLRL